ncbi:hypothetical protein TI39_contig5847g00001 [Zymoseptoria brevis]|uniref:Uncharacterized protein n=1 Tax=Zymoseptoria brevis TaxID=1047168 RepID=A0A0F4G545_9PEZI|nr:hypothetical protein TI39_contig5847g00001 [Zymoseptoria brevis]
MASNLSKPSSNTLPTILLLLISALSLYGMRLSPVTHVMADMFKDMWSTPDFHWPTNGVLARKVYTGIPLVDFFFDGLWDGFLTWECRLGEEIVVTAYIISSVFRSGGRRTKC